MQYNFDEIMEYSGCNSAKIEECGEKFGAPDVIPLWMADMDFRTAQPVIDALTQRARQGIFGYTSRPHSYFETICAWQKRRNGWDADPALASFCAGVAPALSAIVHQFSSPGDWILVQPPVYGEFEGSVNAWGRRPLLNRLAERNGHYTVDFDKFEDALRQGPKFFILCSPHNPVGRVWTQGELLRMAELCLKYKVMIISDEIHSDLILFGNKHIPTASLSEEIAANTITCVSGIKTFNLAGLQACTIVFPNHDAKNLFEQFWKKLDMLRNNAFSVVAMEAAYRHGEEWLGQVLRYIEGNVRLVREYCRENIPAIKPNNPEGTYLMWLDCRDLGLDDRALADFTAKAGVGLFSGTAFGDGGAGHMRLNAASPRSVLQKALERLARAAKAL